MPRSGCWHCRPPAERKRLDALAEELNLKGGNTAPRREVVGSLVWTVTTARHPGKCGADCGEPIEIGDKIIKLESNVWAHEECSEAG